MSSEQLADGVNPLDAELAATWDVLKGYSGRDTDLGIARRFGGAAAAYSLRDIGAMNGRVVKVRRDLAGEEADPEEDFSANQVSSGALENWVNGKLESTLPADVDPTNVAAAYSLRKVKSSYSGDAVRVRRNSDGTEVDVAFDSDDKVSTSSSISVLSGSTTATDLNGFLNEVLTVGVAVEGGSSGSSRPDSFTNATNSSFTATVTDIAGGYFPYKSNAGDAVTVSFDLVLSAGSSPSLNTSLGVDTVATRATGTAYTSSGSYTFTLNCNAEADHIRFADGDDGTFAITNFRVTSHTHQAFVHTWYDQAGSNNAVQGTDANQPKIAESGALLADGITFDGSDDFLQTSGQVLTNNYTGARSLYGVCKINTDSGYIFGDAANGTDEGTSFYSDTASDKIFFTNGKSGTLTTFDNITTIEGRNFLISSNYNNNNATTIHKNANNYGYAQGTGSYNFNTSSNFTIGDREGGSSAATRFDGSVQEIIAYNSDQSNNRFKIESNINNYYGLYNDEYEWDDATNTEWQNDVTDGITTFTANGKDGFTITATGNNISNFKYAITSPSTASDDYYQVSFNLDDPDGLFTNAQLRATATGSGATSQTLDNGFNALSLRTGSSFEYMAINSNGGGSSKTATLSDFKISLIARDGLVENWYDQSGNGNNASQSVSSKQPYIVEHGGLCKMQSGNPAVKGTRYTSSSIVFLELDNTIAEPTTIFSTYYTNRSFSLLHCGSNVGGAPRVQLNTNGIKPQFSSADDMGITSVDNTKDSLMTLFSAENGGTAVLRKDGTQIDTLTRTEVESRPLAFLFRHQNNNGRRGVFVDSFIVFNSDKTSDFVEIENELKRANNL